MKTTAWGWLTAGVLALGLNGFYQDGGAAWLHRAVEQVRAEVAHGSGLLADLATGKIDRFMLRANILQARTQTAASCRASVATAKVQGKIARTQGQLAHFEVMSARQRAAFARMEARRAEMEAKLADMQFTPYEFESSTPVCRRIVVHVPEVHVNVPEVHVSVPRITVHQPAVKVEVPAVHVEVPEVTAPI